MPTGVTQAQAENKLLSLFVLKKGVIFYPKQLHTLNYCREKEINKDRRMHTVEGLSSCETDLMCIHLPKS